MNSFLKRSINFFAIPLFTLFLVASCDKDMSVMLDNSATSNVGVAMIDSFTVNTSTFQFWDVPSVGTGMVLVGKADVPQLGTVKSTSYFRVGFPSLTNDIPEAAVFDSLNLVLRPSHIPYSFGDTTQEQTIHVHRLTETMATRTPKPLFPNQPLPAYITRYLQGSSIFSEQTFDYNPTPIGERSFRPHVHTIDSVDIRLADNIGQDFFERIKAGDIRMASNENFIDYFRGLVLVPDESSTAAVAFNDTLRVRINYSYPGADGHSRRGSKDLSLISPGAQHNNITYDRAGSVFEGLAPAQEISTSATGGLTYVQAGSATVAKISFPSLKEFLQIENIAINKAELVIETSSSNRNTMYPAPNNLMLLINNAEGIPTSFLLDPYSGQQADIQEATFVPGREMGQNGTYTFNLMAFLQQLKSTSNYDNSSFYLSATVPSLFGGSFNTAVIATENAKPKIKLNILYTKFR